MSSVVDLVLKLIEVKRDERFRYFDTMIQPLYESARVVHDDYKLLMDELCDRLTAGEGYSVTVCWLKSRREQYRSMRDEVRVALERLPMKHGIVDDDPLIKGVWGLLRGGLSLTDDGHVPYFGYGNGDHTVLDMLLRIRDASSPREREHLVRLADAQRRSIEDAWADAMAGYYDYRNRV